MKNQFLLTFPNGMPKGTAQQKRYNSYSRTYFKDKKLQALEDTFFNALKPYRPKTPSERPIRLYILLAFNIKSPRRLWGAWKITKPDADNYCKTFIDQMTQVGFWNDDAQIASLKIEKTYAESASIFVRWEELEDRPT